MLAEAMCKHTGFTYAPSRDPAGVLAARPFVRARLHLRDDLCTHPQDAGGDFL